MPVSPPTFAPPTAPRWPARIYPGQLDQAARLRADLHTDLTGYPAELADTVVLCACEVFANAVEHTRSGEQGGRVVRALYRPHPTRLRLVLVDDGSPTPPPQIASQPSPEPQQHQEHDLAESGRGLLLIEHLAHTWGHHPLDPHIPVLGAAVWVEFCCPGLR